MNKTKSITVKMEWNELQQMYLMKRKPDDCLIYDFHDCGNVRLMFRGLDKSKPQVYQLSVKKVEEGESA